MTAGSRSRRRGTCYERTKCRCYSKKVNQLGCLAVKKRTASALVLSLLLVLTSLSAIGQSPDPNRRTLVIRGLIVTAQGRPVARAAVEVRDLRGIKMATGLTDTAGSFAITTVAKPGEYLVLAAKKFQIGDERITLDQTDREVTIALPVAPAASLSEQTYTVSAQALGVRLCRHTHLKLAQESGSRTGIARTTTRSLGTKRSPSIRKDPPTVLIRRSRACASVCKKADRIFALISIVNGILPARGAREIRTPEPTI